VGSEILCIGEVLWDALPGGLFLGGAPFNVACHLNELGQLAAFASRVGDDLLGQEIIRRLKHRRISTDLLQTDSELPTGFVIVSLDTAGSPDFTIVEPSAWDRIECDSELLEHAERARAIVFGSLAQRNATTRATIERMMETDTTLVFDVNLRPPFDSREVVEKTLGGSHIVKLNDDELRRLAEWFRWPAEMCLREMAARLSSEFSCPTVCVTRGANGAALWHEEAWHEHPGFAVEVTDTVGSGDSFLAALLTGLFAEVKPGQLLAYANAVGAYVATQSGATPVHDPDAIRRIMNR